MKPKLRYIRLKAITKAALKPERILGTIYAQFRKSRTVNTNLVMLESHHGVSMKGSPYYMAKHIVEDARFSHLHLVVVCPRKEVRSLRRSLGTSNVTLCRPRSIRYAYYLAIAGFLISDVTFPVYFSRRNSQKYLNTWHGTPLKKMGRETPVETLTNVSNTQRNFLHATHLLAPNNHTERMLLKDYMIDKLWKGQILRSGYPRNDILVNQNDNDRSDETFHIAFLPTWRGTLSTLEESSEEQIEDIQGFLKKLDQNLPSEVVVWVNLHPLLKNAMSANYSDRIKEFPSDIETYEHLAVCDLLLTDYSSVLFDFAASGKPVVLYTPDVEAYEEERGLSLSLDSIPFEKFVDIKGLVESLIHWCSDPTKTTNHTSKFRDEFCPFDDGNSTSRLCDQFLLGEPACEHKKVEPEKKIPTVLLFGGAFLNNGITTSLKTLISLINPERMNLLLWVNTWNAQRNGGSYFCELDKSLQFVPTQHWILVSPFEALRFLLKDVFSKSWEIDDQFSREIWRREWKRRFGNSEFDTVVHFTGYERGISLLMFGCKTKKVMYMHNDMAAEVRNSRLADPRSLKLALELADSVAIVRKGVETEYSAKHLDVRSKTHVVPNTYSLDCVAKARRPLVEAFKDGDEDPLYSEVMEALDQPGAFRIINLARFSPEKGQLRLIDAFEDVWSKTPNAQLFLLGAHGVLYEQVIEKANESPARKSIFVVLGSGNPFPLVSRMDLLVSSSFYEGLPMVFFEALAFEMPIVSTDIPGPSEFLRQGYALVVENSTEGLIAGMKAGLANQIPQRPFDFDLHNQHAVEEFYKVTGAQNA